MGTESTNETVGRVMGQPAGSGARLRLDDAGVVSEADGAAADLLGCRERDLIGKPFVVFVGKPLRRPLFVALRDARVRRVEGQLHGALVSRDPVRLRAAIALVPEGDGIEVTISDVERVIDPDRLYERLRRVSERQRALAETLDAVTRPRPAALPDLDVGTERRLDDAAASSSTMHDWRLLPSGELLMFGIAAHGQSALHAELVRSVGETVRALALTGTPHRELFARIERLCGLRGAGPMASAGLAYVSPDGSRASVIAAGGASPLVRRADGTVERVASYGPALGGEAGQASSLDHVLLAVGDALVLGVEPTEAPEPSVRSEQFARRLASLEPRELGAAAMARQLMDPGIPTGVAVVLCAIRGSVGVEQGSPVQQVTIRLVKDELRDAARAREQLSSWLAHRAVRAETIERAAIVISELVTNAVAAASERAELKVSVARGAVLIEVTDDGSTWHPEAAISPGSDGGHGLRVSGALCEELHVASSAAGTVIRARVGARPMR